MTLSAMMLVSGRRRGQTSVIFGKSESSAPTLPWCRQCWGGACRQHRERRRRADAMDETSPKKKQKNYMHAEKKSQLISTQKMEEAPLYLVHFIWTLLVGSNLASPLCSPRTQLAFFHPAPLFRDNYVLLVVFTGQWQCKEVKLSW